MRHFSRVFDFENEEVFLSVDADPAMGVVGLQIASGVEERLKVPALWANGAWVHVVLTRDRSSLRLYKNGNLIAEQALRHREVPSNVITDLTMQSASLGKPSRAGQGAARHGFKGIIANLRVWSSGAVLSTLEALNLFNNALLESKVNAHTVNLSSAACNIKTKNVQRCLNMWTTEALWNIERVPNGFVGSSNAYPSCFHFNGRDLEKVCVEAAWRPLSGFDGPVRCKNYISSAHFLDEVITISKPSSQSQQRPWVLFLGDSSLRIFYSAFASRFRRSVPLPAGHPHHDFCYNQHRKYDLCSELDGSTNSTSLCHRIFPGTSFFDPLSFTFATRMQYYKAYFIEAVGRRASSSDRFGGSIVPHQDSLRFSSLSGDALEILEGARALLPDIIIVRNGPWELSNNRKSPIVNLRSPLGSSERVSISAHEIPAAPSEKLAHFASYRSQVKEFIAFLEASYAIQQFKGTVIWIVGNDDPNITSGIQPEDGLDPFDLASLQNILREEVRTSQDGSNCRMVNHITLDIEPLLRDLPAAAYKRKARSSSRLSAGCTFSFVHLPGLFAEQVSLLLANTVSLLGGRF